MLTALLRHTRASLLPWLEEAVRNALDALDRQHPRLTLPLLRMLGGWLRAFATTEGQALLAGDLDEDDEEGGGGGGGGDVMADREEFAISLLIIFLCYFLSFFLFFLSAFPFFFLPFCRFFFKLLLCVRFFPLLFVCHYSSLFFFFSSFF